MKLKLSLILALLVSITFLSSNAFGTTLTWDFTGHITLVHRSLETISVGDTFRGYFSYSYEKIPTNDAPGCGYAAYGPDDNLSIEYGVYFDDISTSGTASWMFMEDETFPSVPSSVFGHQLFVGNSEPELSYIEDLTLSRDSLSILAGDCEFEILGDFDTFEYSSESVPPAPVPEPATLILFGTGIFFISKSKKKILPTFGMRS